LSTVKEQFINEVIAREGGYVNDPDDSGKETNFGVTVAVARAHHYMGSMRDMRHEVAFEIYEARYWDAIKADALIELSETIAVEMIDTAVNMGARRASVFLQRSLNVLNQREKLYPDLKVDGAIGLVTLDALTVYLIRRKESVLVKALNCLQGAFYIELAERREKDEKFVYGWLKNRVTL